VRNLSSRSLRGQHLSLPAIGLIVAGSLALGFLAAKVPLMWTADQPWVEPESSSALDASQSSIVSTCFTPAQACADLIVGALDHARSEIRVQAYGFTSFPILSAIVSARQRGVDVSVILDKSDARPTFGNRISGAEFVARAEVPVFIDYQPKIAHNKVIIIDRHMVVTGSYNFTASAERKNAENITFVDSAKVAGQFLANWESRRAVSRIFQIPNG